MLRVVLANRPLFRPIFQPWCTRTKSRKVWQAKPCVNVTCSHTCCVSACIHAGSSEGANENITYHRLNSYYICNIIRHPTGRQYFLLLTTLQRHPNGFWTPHEPECVLELQMSSPASTSLVAKAPP